MQLLDQINKALSEGHTVTLHFCSGETQDFSKGYANLTDNVDLDGFFKADFEDGIVELICVDAIEKITIAR